MRCPLSVRPPGAKNLFGPPMGRVSGSPPNSSVIPAEKTLPDFKYFLIPFINNRNGILINESSNSR